MATKLVLTLLLALASLGCLPGSKAPELAALLEASPALIQSAPSSGPVPQDQWPPALLALDPKEVYARPEGIYIVTSTFFVEEKGLFLARSATFHAAAGGDPEYREIVPGLYSYQIKG